MGQIEILLVSRIEASALVDRALPEETARVLLEMGPSVVVETLGAEGALVVSDEGQTRVPAFLVDEVQDTTGAGDAFAAGLVTAFLKGLDWEPAARTGCAASALNIRHLGARNGLPSWREALSLVGAS